mmetsp:Transcript_27946/g.73743  ORF Transcript_27946/g.73743 Transcript_27946/m.73743 type:complete len:117 (+) Transcript_27946:202-552(+)
MTARPQCLSNICVMFGFAALCLCSVSAERNATCLASRECDGSASLHTVPAVFSKGTSLLDESLSGMLRIMEAPSMHPAQFPTFAPQTGEVFTAKVLTSDFSADTVPQHIRTELGLF